MSIEDFEFGRVLGKGVFGSVIIVKRKQDKEIYAMKRVKISGLTKRELENSFNEVRLLASLNHKNVIGYREAFYDQNSNTLNIVMEFADDGDLSTKIKKSLKNKIYFDERMIWSTLIQILEGLKYLHKSDIIHRDLKSANIFLTKKGFVKIGDLNVSKIIGKNMALTQTGTPYYASPEVWSDRPYDYKCDIWSAGCIIYEMASLRMPFRGTSMQVLYSNVMKGEFAPIPLIYSDDLMRVIKLMLVKNPQKRPSAQELLNNEIILDKIDKYGLEDKYEEFFDEKALLMRTIKIPRNLNQMNQVNYQLPKNYKKEIINNRREMFENDEYETAKNSFYNSNENNKKLIRKKNVGNLSCLQVEYDNIKKKKISNKKAITDNELNNLVAKSKINIKKYKNNLNYNYSSNNINNKKQNHKAKNLLNKNCIMIFNNDNKENIDMNRINKNEKDILNKINRYNINKKDNKFIPKQQIIEGRRRYPLKKENKESLHISTSNIFTTEEEKNNKYHKIKTTINEPIKLLRKSDIKNSLKNNIHLHKEKEKEKNKYIQITNLNKGYSLVNNKQINIPTSISSIQKQSRQKRYMCNPSIENELKNKNLKTINCDKGKYNSKFYDKKINNKGMGRNKSCKGNIKINNKLMIDDENIVGERILKRKKRMNRNTVRRNISTEIINKKNSVQNNNQNIYRNNSHIVTNNRNSVKNNNSNNHRLRRVNNEMRDLISPFEFEKIIKQRLPSAKIDKKRNNNVNVRINFNNNYNYINNINIDSNFHKFITENTIHNNQNYKANNRLIRPKSTSSIISDNRDIYRNQCLNLRKEGKNNDLNINDITDNYISNKNDSEKKYNNFYKVYCQKFNDEKKRNKNDKIINSNQNQYINNMNQCYNSNNYRQIIYEKINIVNNSGEGKKYIKGPAIIRNIRTGNYHNQCHKEIFKCQNSLKINSSNDYSIHNFINKENKDEKIGPRVILPKKMIVGIN